MKSFHSSLSHPLLRHWSTNSTSISKSSIIYPVFVTDSDPNDIIPIQSLPNINRYGSHALVEHLKPLVESGLTSILLFPVPTKIPKSNDAICATDPMNPAFFAINLLAIRFPDLLICVDVCLCAFTDSGHCGILKNGCIDNDASIKRIAELSCAYIKAGAHVVAPSDMMDNRIFAIKTMTRELGLNCCIMSYAAKFASCLYGPFRDAAGSGLRNGGSRVGYQLPCQSRGLAIRAMKRDVEEGADIIMVKPGGAYLDIIRDGRNILMEYPIAVYQVSGEYAMLWYASQNGVFGLEEGVMESLGAMMRSGANILITYYAPQLIKEWIK